MVVTGTMLADEMRRRRVGRAALVNAVDRVRQTWLPGELHQVPTPLLVLAAMSLSHPRPVPEPL